METSKKQISLFTEDKSTSLQADSLANHTHQQANDLERKMTVTSGLKCLEQFERFNHVGLWAKTFVALLIGMEDWYSKRCRLTWKMKGTKSNRLYFQLQASTLPIEETEFGSLPTPVASDVEGGISDPRQIKNKGTRWVRVSDNTSTEFGAKLRDVAQMLPTPTSRDWKGKQANEYKRDRGEESQYKMQSLPGVAEKIAQMTKKDKMLPTPTASDTPAKNTGKRNQDSIPKRIRDAGGKTSQLNPLFVEEMMGFPESWTLSPFLNGETNQLKPTETP